MQMPDVYVLITRLVLAGILGGLIGAEREYRAKVAGMRTHLLVAIGAAQVFHRAVQAQLRAGRPEDHAVAFAARRLEDAF